MYVCLIGWFGADLARRVPDCPVRRRPIAARALGVRLAEWIAPAGRRSTGRLNSAGLIAPPGGLVAWLVGDRVSQPAGSLIAAARSR